ncbi:FabD/lysophospholipase-like protein [Ceratocystis lukuohia]|uniref:FabD/lysophospholipase-like protein n=1 Tax=Ceratocystis lukuohia TaxID=2019550 RepID=A0ABR4MF46_9PEZI
MPDPKSATERPAIILSLDGGGVRGLSSLIILESILEGIQEAEGLEEVPRPSQIFSLIGGTGTGGIIAIMLGRLGMTVRQAIEAYKKLIKTAPAPKLTKAGNLSPGCFSASDLEKAIKEMVQEKYSGANTRQNGHLLFRNKSCTNTAVLALTKVNIDTHPTLFTTYGTSSAFSGCTVWDVATAVSTANILSGSTELGRDKEVFISAEFGYNNPCEILISEAEKKFKDRELIILSIGTGITKVVEIGDESESLNSALAKLGASSKTCEIRLDDKYHDDPNYQRFNVENGLREIKPKTVQTAAEIAAHSRNYIRENEASITDFVDLVISATEFPLLHTKEQAITLPPPQFKEKSLAPILPHPQTEEQAIVPDSPQPGESAAAPAVLQTQGEDIDSDLSELQRTSTTSTLVAVEGNSVSHTLPPVEPNSTRKPLHQVNNTSLSAIVHQTAFLAPKSNNTNESPSFYRDVRSKESMPDANYNSHGSPKPADHSAPTPKRKSKIFKDMVFRKRRDFTSY